MKIKKSIIILITLITLLIIFVFFKSQTFLINNIDKLFGNVSYPTSNGVKITCDKDTISINEEVECTLTGYLSGGSTGVAGKIQSQLVLLSVSKASGWLDLEELDEDDTQNTGIINYIRSNPTDNQFEIATFRVKGNLDGQATISFIHSPYADETKVVLVDNNTQSVEVSDATYTINVTSDFIPNLSSDNTLKTLNVSNTTLASEFDSSITSYITTVDNSIDSVTIDASVTDEKSSILEGLGKHNLNVGINTIDVKVRAENGQIKTYTIIITRKDEEIISDDTSKSSDNTLKSLSFEDATLIPKFDSSKNQNYVVIVEDNATNIKINAIANNEKSNISYSENLNNNIINFNENDSTKEINVIVTAENGSKKYTTITLMRKSYYNEHKNEVDNNTDECVLSLSSSVYQIDNEKLEINNVNINHSIETIRSNLTNSCGTLMVNENKVVLSTKSELKTYTINRVWLPQTGQKVMKYSIVIIILLLGIAGLIIYRNKSNK